MLAAMLMPNECLSVPISLFKKRLMASLRAGFLVQFRG
jgi:hypothetical protein